MYWFRRNLTGPARRLAALSVLLITVTILLAGCGGGASGVSSGIAPYMMALWLFGLSAVSLFFTGCGGENNGVPGFGQSTVTSTSSSSSSTSGGSTFQATPTSLTFANTPGSIAQPVSHAATALTKLPPVQVDILDQNGHLDTNATNLVTISLGANPSHATLKGTLTKAAVAGVATFDDLELTLAGSGFTLVASSPGLKGATSAAFNVSALPTNLAYIDRQDYEVAGEDTVGVALVDTKGDGSQDLIVSSYFGSNKLSVFLGNGDGTFQSPANIALPNNVLYVHGADINGDGHPDLVVDSYTGHKIFVLLGNGDGTFQNPIATSTVSSPDKFAVGDFNGDNKPDIVFTSESEVQMLIGNGDGTFQHSSFFTTVSCFDEGLVVADFNKDGNLDLATIGACSGNIKVLLGNGDGTFQVSSFFLGESELTDITTGDFNGDGIADLAMVDFYNFYLGSAAVRIVLGNGDGTFQSPINYAIPGFNGESGPLAIAAGDVDGDGTTDLITANFSSYYYFPLQTVSVLLGKGDGTFRTPVNYEAGPGALSLAVGDVNGDGKADVAVANDGTSTASVFLGTQQGLLSPSSPLPLPIEFSSYSSTFDNLGPSSATIGDVNGDGIPDFLIVSRYGAVSTFLGVGNGTFQAPLNFALEIKGTKEQGAYDTTLVDLDGDGKLDLVVAQGFYAGAISIALGNGDGTFKDARQIVVEIADLAVGDFNGDGKPDLAVTDYNNYHSVVRILLGNGDATFQSPLNVHAPANSDLRGMAVGDFNNDGKLDVAAVDYYHGSVQVFLGNGDGTLQGGHAFGVGDSRPQAIAVADLNGDGHLDLVTENYYNSVSVMLGNGDGTFQAGICYSIGNPTFFSNQQTLTRDIVLADVNADGVPDIVVPCYQESNVKVLIGNGDGTFQNPISLGTGANPRSVAAGDLNGDGKVDFVTADYNGYTATIIFHQ